MNIHGLVELVSCGAAWSAACTAVGYISGWRGLSKLYASGSNPSDSTWYAQSGRIGWLAYRNCLIVGVSAEGLYLSVLLPFRPGHSALLIPWTDIDGVDENTVLFMKCTVVRVGAPTSATIELAPSWYPEIERLWSTNHQGAMRCITCGVAGKSLVTCTECGSHWHRSCSGNSCPTCGVVDTSLEQ